jgi:thiamine biosynthesis lipoprotein
MRLFLISFLTASVIFIASCSKPEPLYNTQSYVFGTLVDITIYGDTETKSQQVSAEISRNFQRLHHRLHAWRKSELQTINRAFTAGKTPITIQPDIAAMIQDISALSSQSGGAFNPAIGGLIKTWGFQHDEFKPVIVDNNTIASLVAANPKMTDIVIEGNQIYSNNPAVQLDLGGYAKGYALDRAIEILKAHGIKNALINIGGNIIALGKHDDKPWRIGIQHPRKPNAIAMLNLESGWAIGTSGDYQRYFELNGKRYCHIINPNTGYPVEGVQAVTVLIPPQIKNAGVLSDVASKPIFIARAGARAAAAKAMQIENYLIIESANKILLSASMAKYISWLDQDASKNAIQIQP